MLGGLSSGSGLMTMIGLGVGAFEILKQQSQGNQAGGMGQAPRPPGFGTTGAGMPPPVPGGFQAAPPPPPPMPGVTPVIAPPPRGPVATDSSSEELAVRLIQVMVAAAHADGAMDQKEERAVLDKLRGADLSQEEKMFLLDELHRPQSIEVLTAGISDPSVAKTMYLLAVAAIEIDTEAERSWLDQLARQLGLSKGMQDFIEEQR